MFNQLGVIVVLCLPLLIPALGLSIHQFGVDLIGEQGKQPIGLARADVPVDAPRRIAGLVIAHAEKVHAGAADARGDRPRVDARPPRADGDAFQPQDGRQDEQLPGRRERVRMLDQPQTVA